jgi:hypothetical protein
VGVGGTGLAVGGSGLGFGEAAVSWVGSEASTVVGVGRAVLDGWVGVGLGGVDVGGGVSVAVGRAGVKVARKVGAAVGLGEGLCISRATPGTFLTRIRNPMAAVARQISAISVTIMIQYLCVIAIRFLSNIN